MPEDDELDRAQVAALARRAGLQLTPDELTDLVAAYRRNQPMLAALQSRLVGEDNTTEPATTFQAGQR